MKFLVLFVISLFSLPKSNLIARLDLIFLNWQAFIGSRLPKLKFYLIFFLSIVFPLLTVFFILYFLTGFLWNIPLFFAILIFVYYALDNRKDLTWLARYTRAYYNEDKEKLQLYAYKLIVSNNFQPRELGKDIEVPEFFFKDSVESQNLILQKIIWLGFETFFLPLFWYLVSTPLSPVFIKLLEISIKNKEMQGEEVDKILLKIQKFLHWVPARFFTLTTTFVAFSREELKIWWQDKFDFNISTQDYLYRQIKSYLQRDTETEEIEIFSPAAQKDLLGLKDLLWRTLALWLGIVAVVVILF